METGLNLNNVTVDNNGRVVFSGLSSGIDFKAAVDSIIAARRIPADRLEAEIDENQQRITALQDLRTLLSTMKNTLSDLHGAISIGSAQDAFESKAAFATTSRQDGGTASAANNLVGVSVTNAAELGSHTVEVRRTAAAHKLSSDAAATTDTALSVSGAFTINGQSITVSATDTLLDIRDRINNANTGTNATGVTASIVSAGANSNFLILTADNTGETMTLADTGPDTVLQDLGILDGGGGIKNQLQAARTAQLYADGLLDQTDSIYESSFQSSAANQLGTTGTLRFSGAFGNVDIAYSDTDSISALASAINGNATLQANNISASVVSDGAGVRLELTDADGDAFTLSEAGAGNVINDLGIDNKRLLIERDTNTIGDLFAGVTLSLFQAEPGTTIKVDIDRDLTAVKSRIEAFVESYNALTVFINEQSVTDPVTGEIREENGPLTGNRTLASIESALTSIIGAGTVGVDSAFSVLAQIGIDFVDNSTLSDDLQRDTLDIDNAKLDEALLNNPEQVRKLFSFDFSSSDPRVTLLGFTSNTTYSADGYTLNIGNVGSGEETGQKLVNDKTVVLNDATDGVGATTSGSFDINGVSIAYDVTTDTLETLGQKIAAAGVPGIQFSIDTQTGGGFKLRILSSQDPIVIDNDTGDLVSTLNFETTGHLVGQANIGGAADGTDNGTVTISGRTLTVTSESEAEGLKVFFNGTADASGIDMNFTVGVGAQLFHRLDNILAPTTGAVESEINTFETQNDEAEARIIRLLERLEFQRDQLTARFIAMETALASFSRVRDSITQITNGMFQDRNN